MSLWQSTSDCSWDVRNVVEETDHGSEHNTVCNDHWPIQGNCDEVVEVHFPKIIRSRLDEDMFKNILDDVTQLHKEVEKQARMLWRIRKVLKQIGH